MRGPTFHACRARPGVARRCLPALDASLRAHAQAGRRRRSAPPPLPAQAPLRGPAPPRRRWPPEGSDCPTTAPWECEHPHSRVYSDRDLYEDSRSPEDPRLPRPSWKSCVGASRPRVRIPLSPPKETGTYGSQATPNRDGVAGRVCTSVCTPPSIEELERRLVEAELAGRRIVADALACRLESYALAINVAIVDLGEERRRRSPR